MKHEVVTTRAGARAVRSVEAGEVMHPGVGPLVEAELLYVRQSRLDERLREAARGGAGDRLVVFDVGLGAGSNALAARAASERRPAGATAARLELVSFERDLGALALALDPAHAAAFGFTDESAAAARALLERGVHETPHTTWRLEHGDVLEALARRGAAGAEGSRADVVFWDPFSPRANPELWTIAAFAAARAAAAPRATLFTYSASTATRVALLLAGWTVGAGDGTGDKKETTAAAVDARDLARPLDRRWATRLARPDAPLPIDASATAAARAAASPQFR